MNLAPETMVAIGHGLFVLSALIYMAIGYSRKEEPPVGEAEAGHGDRSRFPLALKIAAILIIADAASDLLLLPIQSSGFAAEGRPKSYIIGRFSGGLVMIAIWITAGVQILLRKPWARILGMVLLALSGPKAFFDFSAGMMAGLGHQGAEPSIGVLIASLLIIGSWKGFWLYILFRKSSRDFLARSPLVAATPE